MKLTLGFSPCPNDTFIFDALVNGKIDTGDLSFDVQLQDVQTLNEMAMAGAIDVTKISYGSLPLVVNDYIVLDSGSALGMGVGPLLISALQVPAAVVEQCTVAIPGKNTTANVLFSLAYPETANKVFLRYDAIEDFVLSNNGSIDHPQDLKLGVIIHENRFTYQDKGLVKLTDLGRFWEEETSCPVPLGGIVARRSLPGDIIVRIQDLIRKSLECAYREKNTLSSFVRQNAMEMSEEVMWQHINLYVNEFSLSLGNEGRTAIEKFIEVHTTMTKISLPDKKIFA